MQQLLREVTGERRGLGAVGADLVQVLASLLA